MSNLEAVSVGLTGVFVMGVGCAAVIFGALMLLHVIGARP